MPMFVVQRTLYEARERPSKMYSWLAFVTSAILVEIPYQVLCGILVFVCFYYPVFGIQSAERQGLMLLFCIQNFVFSSTFAHLLVSTLPSFMYGQLRCLLTLTPIYQVAAAPDAETAGKLIKSFLRPVETVTILRWNRQFLNSPVHHVFDFQWGYAATRRPSDILDIHVSIMRTRCIDRYQLTLMKVPSFAIHLPRSRHGCHCFARTVNRVHGS